MSSSIWTPHAVATEARACRLALWRAVEAQHVVATRVLVDDLEEQAVLEALLDAAKPPLPTNCAGLDYLLSTPFRYSPPRNGSRFRAYDDPGVWYGAEALRTACAEVGYWRWRFVADSHGLERLDGVAHTVFQAQVKGAQVDLRSPPFLEDAESWRDPLSYTACQAFARVVRKAGVPILRYASVRDPAQGGCAAVLDCRVFVSAGGIRQRQTWFLSVDRRGADWMRIGARAKNAERHEFAFENPSTPPERPRPARIRTT